MKKLMQKNCAISANPAVASGLKKTHVSETYLLSSISIKLLQMVKHLKLILGAIGLLVATLGFVVWFALITGEKAHVRGSLDAIAPVGVEIKNSIEANARYRGYLDGYDDIEMELDASAIGNLIQKNEHILNTTLNYSLPNYRTPSPSNIYVVDTGYNLLNGTPRFFEYLTAGLNESINTTASRELHDDILFFSTLNYYYLLTPIRDNSQRINAYIVIQTDAQYVKAVSLYHSPYSTWIIASLMIVSSVLFLWWIPLLMKDRSTITPDIKRRISIVVFLIICSSQMVFFIFAISQYYLDANKIGQAKTEIILSSLAGKFERFLSKNVGFSSITDIDAYLNTFKEKYPELESVSLIPMNQNRAARDWVSQTNSQPNQNIIRETGLFTMQPFQSSSNLYMVNGIGGQGQGLLLGKLSNKFIFNTLFEISLDLFTVIVINLLLLVELLILLFKMLETTSKQALAQKKIHYSYMRPAAFLFLFGVDISMSFLPLHAEKLYSSFWGLSKDTVMGLPISVEFFFVGISIFISGFWNDRRGWHEPFLVGLFLSATGGIYSWIAPDILHFIISRALVGIGYGFMLLAAQGFVIEYTDTTNRAQGLAQFIAGLYAGSICGGATGALLAEHFGYRSVFLLGAVILYGVMVYTVVFLRHAMVKPSHQINRVSTPTMAPPKWRPFFKNKIVLALILFSSLPASIAVVGFLNYFSPIYLHSIGASQATIGRVLMIYGISLIYLGPMISRHVDASNDKKRYIFIGCILGSITFLIFNFFSGLAAAVLGVFILGLSSSFVIASQGAYLLNLNVTQRLGAGKAIGVFRATSRVGQALGPMVFSLLIISTNVGQDITQMGLLYLLTAFLFLLVTYRDKFEFQRS